MAVDSRQHPQHFNTMSYDAMRYQQSTPQFTNPWGSAQTAQSQMYQSSVPQQPVNDYKTNVSAYSSAPMMPAGYTAAYTSAPSTMSSYAPTSAPQYQPAYGYQQDRRTSHPLHVVSDADRQSFSDALDASRGMVQMSQTDITPRNIYGTTSSSNRTSTDSYGFPGAHSSHSSISSASTYPTYYNSSVSEASTGDYGSASESIDVPTSRTLPRPTSLLGGQLPPAPQSMMGQFSSKVSSSSQKKHKCKVCDKRFTRPSSLQTHMYSHTGEKRKSSPLLH